jgi:hypothetical protein
VIFVGSIILICTGAFWTYRYTIDPLARDAAHQALRENPLHWASLILVFACLIPTLWFIVSYVPPQGQADIAELSQTTRPWSMVLKEKAVRAKDFLKKHRGSHPKNT